MHLARLRLRQFRNYDQLDTEFSSGFHLLLGDNAQGKTNLLEAIYLLATFRSFRGATHPQLVRQGQPGYFVSGQVIAADSHEIRVYWSPQQRKVALDGRPVRKLAECFGILRAVIFCSEDLQLIRGTGRIRRRFLDLLLSQSQPAYLPLLQRYTHALRSRNAILKSPSPDPHALDAFTHELVESGRLIQHRRTEFVPRLSPLVRLAYRRIASPSEDLRIEYRPSVKRDFEVELAQYRHRERSYRSTLIGPHRDDLALVLNDRPAAQFGSEGQKRSLALALKMAQAEYLSGVHGASPVLLIDDVMGELDVHRRQGFLPLLNQSGRLHGQVFMTCTEENWPREWAKNARRWHVKNGRIQG